MTTRKQININGSVRFFSPMMLVHAFAIFTVIGISHEECYAQGGTWVWVKGADTTHAGPVYGVQGVPDVGNTPGALWRAVNWIDLRGNFWLFGGVYDSIGNGTNSAMVLSDLWKYDPMQNTWAWMKGPGKPNIPGSYVNKGVPAPSNNPNGVGSTANLCWADNNENLWLYGTPGGVLWQYNIISNEWTCMIDTIRPNPEYGLFRQASLSNTPGYRGDGATWVDNNNNLWLFGGIGEYQGTLSNHFYNDMWRFNIIGDEWEWMKGPQGPGSTGNYGQKGIENDANLPPPRANFTHWKDEAGNFYMCGGYAMYPKFLYFNDVWKYNPVTNNWTWIAGDSIPNSTGTYIQYCDSSGKNAPAPRAYNINALPVNYTGLYYVFGGTVAPGFVTNGLNDVWLFNPIMNRWTWLSGANSLNDLGNYGAMGVAAPGNRIPARYGHCQWVDENGVLWVFGGVGFDTISNPYHRNYTPCCGIQTKNDLWKFIPDSSCVGLAHNIDTSISVNIYAPNAFSPNGDGINDHFTVFGKNITQYAIKIFDRWGELVYESNNVAEINDTSRGWDGAFKGKLMEPGVYAYSIRGKDAAGNSFSKNGSVTLIR